MPLPCLSAEMAQTWSLLSKYAFAPDEGTRCTLHFDLREDGKHWHKDNKHRPGRPDNAALAIRWFDRQPVAGFSLSGTFTQAGNNARVLLHDIEEALIPSGADLVLFKPGDVIHGVLPVENNAARWSYTITGRLRPDPS